MCFLRLITFYFGDIFVLMNSERKSIFQAVALQRVVTISNRIIPRCFD